MEGEKEQWSIGQFDVSQQDMRTFWCTYANQVVGYIDPDTQAPPPWNGPPYPYGTGRSNWYNLVHNTRIPYPAWDYQQAMMWGPYYYPPVDGVWLQMHGRTQYLLGDAGDTKYWLAGGIGLLNATVVVNGVPEWRAPRTEPVRNGGADGSPPLVNLDIQQPVVGGFVYTGTAELIAEPPTFDQTVTLSSSDPAVLSVPSSVTVLAGSDNVQFSIGTSSVSVPTLVNVTGSCNGGTIAVVVEVDPAP